MVFASYVSCVFFAWAISMDIRSELALSTAYQIGIETIVHSRMKDKDQDTLAKMIIFGYCNIQHRIFMVLILIWLKNILCNFCCYVVQRSNVQAMWYRTRNTNTPLQKLQFHKAGLVHPKTMTRTMVDWYGVNGGISSQLLAQVSVKVW
jgi:hypothetical protein